MILDESFERVFSLKEPVEAVELGLYIIRGDNMYVLLCREAFERDHDSICMIWCCWVFQFGDRWCARKYSRASDRRPDACGAFEAARSLTLLYNNLPGSYTHPLCISICVSYNDI